MKTAESPPIEFIYFDVGGVLMKDFSCSTKGDEMVRELRIDDVSGFWRTWDEIAEPRVCLDYPVDDFQSVIKEQLGGTVPDGYSLMRDGFTSRFERNESISVVFDNLDGRVRLGLLTNMYKDMLPLIRSKQLLPGAEWNVVIDSWNVKLQKPNLLMFEYATKSARTPKERILFVDNTLGNINAAQEFGWQTYHYRSDNYPESSQNLADFLVERLELV